MTTLQTSLSKKENGRMKHLTKETIRYCNAAAWLVSTLLSAADVLGTLVENWLWVKFDLFWCCSFDSRKRYNSTKESLDGLSIEWLILNTSDKHSLATSSPSGSTPGEGSTASKR